MKVLVIDIGGTNVKMLATGKDTPRKFPSGPELNPYQMVAGVLAATRDWEYDAVALGYPGPILCGQPMAEPVNLGPGWVGFDFESAFQRPVKIINDAALQALGSYQGGKMLKRFTTVVGDIGDIELHSTERWRPDRYCFLFPNLRRSL
jgi:predicted NBD/HSP70 family sugar kinase